VRRVTLLAASAFTATTLVGGAAMGITVSLARSDGGNPMAEPAPVVDEEAVLALGLADRAESAVPEVVPDVVVAAAPVAWVDPPPDVPLTGEFAERPPLPRDLSPGDRGKDVAELQTTLTELRFDPGTVDGAYGLSTEEAVWAFQKLNGLEPTGVVDSRLWLLLWEAEPAQPRIDAGNSHVEIYLDEQVLLVYERDELVLVTHVSTGSGESYCVRGDCGVAITPPGAFRFTWHWPGWRRSRLGMLYAPMYFNGGIAVHGSTFVPTWPDSHGCVRIPMHIAEYFPDITEIGQPVYVLDGETEVEPLPVQA